ncbi:YqgE/AlgH family protein [Dactylosporangium sp. NPDC049742]|uniref:YqgE/AlgH family protein n=1 Tax=Dactylosporangium sp. NPDC049742 TaxID=3154737 RepID=UPI0034128643
MTDPPAHPGRAADGLIDVLAARTTMSPLEVLDALWLVPRLGPPPTPGPLPAAPAAAEPGAGPPPPEGIVRIPDPGELRRAMPVPQPGTTAGTDVTLHLPATDELAPVFGDPVRLPGRPAVDGRLEITRQLRGLRHFTGPTGRVTIDEARTARASAEARSLVPVFRPVRGRRLALTLVLDRSTSMGLWGRTVEELHDLLQGSGLFRTVQVWGVDTDESRPVLRTAGGWRHGRSAGKQRDPRQVMDGSGPRAVLVLTDGIGTAWRSTELHGMLDRWSRRCPVAIVHLLPEALWHRTGIKPLPASVHCPRPGAPQVSWQVTVREPFDSLHGRPALPVLELSPDWLGNWSDLMAKPSSRPVSLKVMPLHSTPRRQPAPALPTGVAGLVNEFRAGASPVAFELACHLSAAPLTPSVMRLVQESVLPSSGTAELAEVMLSGLLARVAWDHREPLYEFRPGVRPVLLSCLSRAEAKRVLNVLADVSGPVAAAFGGTLDFRVLAGEQSSTDPARTAAGLPFARVAAAVLAGLGGEHRQLAERIRTRLRDLDPAPSRTSGDGPAPTGAVLRTYAQVPPPRTAGVPLADPWLSRAVIIGSAEHEHLPEVPSIGRNVTALAGALTNTEIWGLAPEHCTVLANPGDPRDVGRAVRQAATDVDTDGLLLVYYAGHGLVDPVDGSLVLGLKDTDPAVPYENGLPFEHIRRAVAGSRARRRIVILDCCYAGRAAGHLAAGDSASQAIADQSETDETVLLVSAARNRTAQAPQGEPYTAFTGELLRIMHEGLPTGPAVLDVQTIWRELTRRLRQRGYELPELRARNSGAEMGLVRNAARHNRDLVGRIVVAAEAVDDIDLHRAVVLILRHDRARGTVGVRIDTPIDRPLPTDLAAGWRQLLTPPAVIFDGGPLSRGDGFVALADLRPDAEHPLHFRSVRDRIGVVSLSADPGPLAGAVAGLRLFSGYLGWGPDQLETDIDNGLLLLSAADARIVLTPTPQRLWAREHANLLGRP